MLLRGKRFLDLMPFVLQFASALTTVLFHSKHCLRPNLVDLGRNLKAFLTFCLTDKGIALSQSRSCARGNG